MSSVVSKSRATVTVPADFSVCACKRILCSLGSFVAIRADPQHLRAWLCGIARNLINNSLRKQVREPSTAGESIDNLADTHSPEPLPLDHTISKEEQAILWRS